MLFISSCRLQSWAQLTAPTKEEFSSSRSTFPPTIPSSHPRHKFWEHELFIQGQDWICCFSASVHDKNLPPKHQLKRVNLPWHPEVAVVPRSHHKQGEKWNQKCTFFRTLNLKIQMSQMHWLECCAGSALYLLPALWPKSWWSFGARDCQAFQNWPQQVGFSWHPISSAFVNILSTQVHSAGQGVVQEVCHVIWYLQRGIAQFLWGCSIDSAST